MKKIGEILPDPNLIKTDKQTNLINQIKNITYGQVADLIKKLPFEVNQKFVGAIAKHIRKVGPDRFNECVEASAKARYPERYLMKCLVNENQACGVRTAYKPGSHINRNRKTGSS